MNRINTLKHSLSAAALLTIGLLAVPTAQATPFTATVLAGFDRESMARVGLLEFDIVAGDGSVRPFDYASAGDGSVRKLGDGSVRSCDGSVMPALGECDKPVIDIGSFTFDGSFDPDPFATFNVSVVNFSDQPVFFSFTLNGPFIGGGYNTLTSELLGTGSADSILLDALVDLNAVPGASVSCASPAACTDAAVTLSPPTQPSGLLGAHLVFMVPAEDDNVVKFTSTVTLSQVAPPAVPEPATLSLLAIGLLAGRRMRRGRAR